MIKYDISFIPSSHYYQIKLHFNPNDSEANLSLPTWIPGSYIIREFSKNIIAVTASQANQVVEVAQINKNTWKLSNLNLNQEVMVSYQVYALDYGIRQAHLDNFGGYFNPTNLCLYLDEYKDLPHQVNLVNPDPKWIFVTALPKTQQNQFVANNYAHLIDSPFLFGDLTIFEFKVLGNTHRLVLKGNIVNNFDSDRIVEDISKICEAQIKLFGGVAPFESYTFLLNLAGDIYTGLEHANSTYLLAPYYSLPLTHQSELTTDYRKLLGLISHEYFHLWNVKRIKPEVFNPYDLDQENYTELLWWFEGITSYYDDLMLYRSGVIDQKTYLGLILDNINDVYKYSGVDNQTLANSSLTTWVKYYRQDENSPNSIVSYYVKGALVGMCLDLLIRSQTNNKYSLDDVIQLMYKDYADKGIDENQIASIIKAATGCELEKELFQFIHSCEALPFEQLLNDFGCDLYTIKADVITKGGIIKNKDELPKSDKISLGAKLVKQALGYKVANIYDGSSLQQAGLAFGDIIVTINSVLLSDVDKQLSLYQAGDEVVLSLFRGEQLINIKCCLKKANFTIRYLQINNSSNLSKWLNLKNGS